MAMSNNVRLLTTSALLIVAAPTDLLAKTTRLICAPLSYQKSAFDLTIDFDQRTVGVRYPDGAGYPGVPAQINDDKIIWKLDGRPIWTHVLDRTSLVLSETAPGQPDENVQCKLRGPGQI